MNATWDWESWLVAGFVFFVIVLIVEKLLRWRRW